MEFNNLSAGDTLADFTAFYITPCRHTPEQVERATAETVEFWAVYGYLPTGEAMAVHDETHLGDFAAALEEIAATGLPLSYGDEARLTTPGGTLSELADRLAELIHDEIPGYDDPADFREDDFDAHPLAALREAIQERIEGDAPDLAQRHEAEQWQITLDWENSLFRE